MPVNRSNVDCTAGLASGAIHVEPRRASGDCRPDGRRPPHITTGRYIVIPSLDHTPRLIARGFGVGPASPCRQHVGKARSVAHSGSAPSGPEENSTPLKRRRLRAIQDANMALGSRLPRRSSNPWSERHWPRLLSPQAQIQRTSAFAIRTRWLGSPAVIRLGVFGRRLTIAPPAG
jgi:hypothetical protein